MNKLLAACLLMGVTMTASAATKTNPLLAKWNGKYGLPPFDKVQVKDFKPAIEAAMDEERREIKKIAENTGAPTFENTIVAQERAGRTLQRVEAIYNVWHDGLNSPEFQKVDEEMAPKMAAFEDEIIQNSKLFKRIEAVYNSPDKEQLTPEQQRLVWLYRTHFVRKGAQLDDQQKTRVAAINQRLATLTTQFTQNELFDEEHDALVIDKAEDLIGLPQSLIDGAAAEAEHRKMKGKWVISNTRSSMEPFLTYSPNRTLREKGFKMWTARGDNGGDHDNNKVVGEILKLRAERSKILGYPSYAAWRLADTMAKDPQTAMDLMMQVWKPALMRVHRDVHAMHKIVEAEGGKFKIEPWDYRYYMEKVRKEKYDFDFNELKPYLTLDNIRSAMFDSAKRLYGFTFVKMNGVPVFNKSMSVYQVLGPKKNVVGIWYFDPYARAGKNSGAWMTAYREQDRLDGKNTITIVSNNANFIPGKKGEPTYISWDDADTMFHEFGHALHGLNSNVTYPSLSGTNTTHDFVEFPSQFNENYLETSESLKFLKDKKGHPLPEALIKKLEKTKTFNAGFETVEFLASAIVDMKLHMSATPDNTIDPKDFESKTLKELEMPRQIVMRHRIPQFGHLFSNEEYAAGYYGYLWSQVLDHDAFEAFKESAGGAYDKATAKRFHDYIMSVGNTVDPAETYRKFRGRDPEVNALLRFRGFPVPVKEDNGR